MTSASRTDLDFSREGSYPAFGPFVRALEAKDIPEMVRLVEAITDPYELSYVVSTLNATWLSDYLTGLGDAATPRQRALLAYGNLLAGWRARTAERAHLVNEYQWREFRRYLVMSERSLLRLVAEDPGHALAWQLRIDNAKGLSLGTAETRRRYDRHRALVPHHLYAQLAMLDQLYPKWGGSWDAARGFARECIRESPPGSINGVLIVSFYLEWASEAEGASLVRETPVIDEILEVARYSVLHPNFAKVRGWVPALSEFAVLLCLAGKVAEAAPFFRAMGRFGSLVPWASMRGDPERNFIRFRDRALAKG